MTDTANQVHRFACEFDPAGSYVESSLGVEATGTEPAFSIMAR